MSSCLQPRKLSPNPSEARLPSPSNNRPGNDINDSNDTIPPTAGKQTNLAIALPNFSHVAQNPPHLTVMCTAATPNSCCYTNILPPPPTYPGKTNLSNDFVDDHTQPQAQQFDLNQSFVLYSTMLEAFHRYTKSQGFMCRDYSRIYFKPRTWPFKDLPFSILSCRGVIICSPKSIDRAKSKLSLCSFEIPGSFDDGF